MKLIYSILCILILLTSCKSENTPLNEDFRAICFVSNGDEIELGNGIYMNPPVIHYVLFLYHDTIFQVQIRDKKSTCSYLKCRRNGKDSLESLFKEYDETSLNEQLKVMKKNGYLGTCSPDGYFLTRKNEILNFGLFIYMDYNQWSKHYYWKEIKLDPGQFPKIYPTIYHTLNSKQWDYFMSDDYYYKSVRTIGRGIEFIADTSLNGKMY
ncbi:hypothetical protein [Fluviicola sp.]|uniref:hypothetical protein n=1 Tax=Fluviicola sp. TaxID=1917219 RepID=UPI0031DC52BD